MGIGGGAAPFIFAIGLVAAGFLALVVISLASAWGVAEALNIKRDGWFKIYVLESLPAAAVPLLYPHLISLTLSLMVVLVFVLIGPVIAMGLLRNEGLIGKIFASGLGENRLLGQRHCGDSLRAFCFAMKKTGSAGNGAIFWHQAPRP